MNERKTLKLGIIYNSLGNQHKLSEKQLLVDRNYVVVVTITNCFIDDKIIISFFDQSELWMIRNALNLNNISQLAKFHSKIEPLGIIEK